MKHKRSKEETISHVLTNLVKDLEPSLYNELYNELLTYDFGMMQYRKFVSEKLSLKYQNMYNENYWIKRGWPIVQSKVLASEKRKCIGNKISPYSVEFWTMKINPITNKNYSIEEANFERNSRRPIRKEYWIKKGKTVEEAEKLAVETKNNNNKIGSKKSKNRDTSEVKAFSWRSTEYWTLRGYSIEDAIKKVSELQVMFSLEICIEKYGAELGKKIWQDRQNNWQATINSKTPEELLNLNKSKNSWKNLSEEDKIDLKIIIGKRSKTYWASLTQEQKDVISQKTKNTKVENGEWLADELREVFELYKSKVRTITRHNELNLLENYDKRGRTNYHLDHKYSIWQGFIDNTPPMIVGHIKNLKMVPFQENLAKYNKCSITLNELLALIKENEC